MALLSRARQPDDAQDLAEFDVEWVQPISTTYRGWTVSEIPPNGQGIAALIMLNLMEPFPMGDFGFHSPRALHTMIEAKKLAYADLIRYVGDPRFGAGAGGGDARQGPGPDAGGADRSTARAQCRVEPSQLDRVTDMQGHDTIYLSVVDRDGNMVSLIQSNYLGFGSGLVPDGAGFMLHNRGALFTLAPEQPNTLAGRKRPLHTIIPGFMEKDGTRISFGIMGGWNQAQAHAQFVADVADYGFTPQEALEAGRFTKATFDGCDVQIEAAGARTRARRAVGAGAPDRRGAAALLRVRVRPGDGLPSRWRAPGRVRPPARRRGDSRGARGLHARHDEPFPSTSTWPLHCRSPSTRAASRSSTIKPASPSSSRPTPRRSPAPIVAPSRLIRQAIARAVSRITRWSAKSTAPTDAPSAFRWIVDPIDGTKSFIRGVPLFGVLIALEIDGRAEVGVCHMPALGETVAAATGLGCTWNGRTARVSTVDAPRRRHRRVLRWPHAGAPAGPRWARLESEAGLLRSWGDCYGHCLVATGRADVMLDPVMNAWDCAALLPIVREAGGRFSDWTGVERIDGGDAVSTNDALHDRVLELLRSARSDCADGSIRRLRR